MPKYEVRKNCEYIATVEAEDVDAAIEKAGKIPDEDWEQAWSVAEAEEVSDENENRED